jgi:hypothetical protein
MEKVFGRARRWQRPAAFALGCLLGAGLLAALAEPYLRLFPPRDFQPYLGEAAPLEGPFAPDQDFGVRYRSWGAFRAEYPQPLPGPTAGPPLWAMFGNSFVQAPGMLADTARARVAGRRVFNLGRNELLYVRFAQARLLLEHGLRPERLFVALMPLDTAPLAEHSLASLHVTARGALTYRPRQPAGPLGLVVAHSRLALTGWVRTGRHQSLPDFNHLQLQKGIPEPLLADLRHLFGQLALTARAHGVPVTVLLIPTHEQITKGGGFGFQDTLTPMLRGLGLGVCDPRAAYLRYPDKRSLFIPDKHFSDAGNRVLLDELLAHLRREGAGPETLGGGAAAQ